jgi:ribosomal protein S18 acetylase RimI-like enzyme
MQELSEKQENVRKCRHDDLETLVEMRLEFLKEAGLLKDGEDVTGLHGDIHEFIEKHLNKDLHLWLAETENEIVATGAVCVWDRLPSHAGKGNGSRIGYVLNMYTRPGYRKKGIASRILQQIMQFLQEESIPKVMLHALEDGKGIYKKFGFSSYENLMEMKIDKATGSETICHCYKAEAPCV